MIERVVPGRILLALLAASSAHVAVAETPFAAPPEVMGAGPTVLAATPAKPALRTPSETSGVALPNLPRLELPPLDVARLLAEDDERVQYSLDKVQRVGVVRDLGLRAADGAWLPRSEGGGLWAAEVASVGALGIRLHLTGVRLAVGSIIVVLPAEPAPSGPRHLARREVLPGSPAELWLATVPGERVRLEIEVPSGGRPGFTIDQIVHLYVDPVAEAASPCYNDVTCFPAWANTALAVGKITFVEGRNMGSCSGELLNTRINDQTPYFLTAHHCVSTSAVAATAEVFWKYQTATCGGLPPSINSVPTSSGATLLATAAPSDFTLLMINGALPRRLYWAGWTAKPVPDGTASAVIHQPGGDFKRISFGNKASDTTCGGADHIRIDYTSGPTAVGSSGGGVFRADTQQLFGQLDCGPSACGSVTDDDYGAFAVTYPLIAKFLQGGTDDNSEPNNTCTTARGVGPGSLTDRIVKSTAPDWYSVRVPVGKTLTVTITFDNADGDIDARLYTGCSTLLSHSNGQSNTETLTYTNTTANPSEVVEFQIFLYLGTRNSYDVTVALQ